MTTPETPPGAPTPETPATVLPVPEGPASDTPAPESSGGSASAEQRSLVDRLFELDFTNPYAFALLAVAYIGSRVAWLDRGYGTDPDAWRVALTATVLREDLDYYPSRLPGYPLHELVTTVFIDQGWVWTNMSTVIISLVGVFLFAWLARKLELPNRGLLTLGFAFAPLLWINSVMTMDYMWALTFILAAYLALIHKSPTLAGLLLGIAAGFRLTSLFMLPAFWLLLWRTDDRGQLRPLTMTSIGVTIVAFSPVIFEYGLTFLNFFDQSVPIEEFVKRLGKDGLGVIGGLALLGALALALPRLRALPHDLRANPHVLTWAATIVIFALTYMRLPHEIAYLIPLFPFGYFLMSRYFSRGLLTVSLIVIVLAGFVDITTPDDEVGLTTSTITSARIGKGMLLSDLDTLDNQMDFANEVHELTRTHRDIKKPAVVMLGFIYPEMVMLHLDALDIDILEEDTDAISQLSDKGRACQPTCESNPTLEYVWLLDFDLFQEIQEEGAAIYVTADAERSTFAVYGYRPGYFGAIRLPLSRENPSVGEGTASTDR